MFNFIFGTEIYRRNDRRISTITGGSLVLLMLSFFPGCDLHEHHEEAHTHGSASFYLALEKDGTFTMRGVVPAVELYGHERSPTDEKESAVMAEKEKQLLESLPASLQKPGGSLCTITDSSLSRKEGEEGHADLQFQATFQCGSDEWKGWTFHPDRILPGLETFRLTLLDGSGSRVIRGESSSVRFSLIRGSY